MTDVNSDQQVKGLETDLVVDRDTASRLGLTASQVDNTLYDAFGQRQVSTIYESLNQYHVVMTVAPQFWQDPATLKDVFVSTSGGAVTGTQSSNAVAGTVAASAGVARTPAANTSASVAADSARNASMNAIAVTGKGSASSGQAVSTHIETMIPLSAFSHYETGATPLSVNHQGQFASGTISFNLTTGASLSDAVAAVNRQTNLIHMPFTVQGSFQGTARTYQQSIGSQPILILAALIAIYVVLGILYESYAHPLTILSTLPSAGWGALLALMLFNVEFSLIALIGVFLLIGIVKKNAIIMIDFAIQAERNEGLSPRDSIFQASVLRFRPIMMTTMAALLGAVPLAVGFGNGSELRRPLGIAIVGGLVLSQLLTLYTTPVVYLYVDRLRLAPQVRHSIGSPGAAAASVMVPHHMTKHGLVILTVALLAGCAVGPTYHRPGEWPCRRPSRRRRAGSRPPPTTPPAARPGGRRWATPTSIAWRKEVVVSNQSLHVAGGGQLRGGPGTGPGGPGDLLALDLGRRLGPPAPGGARRRRRGHHGRRTDGAPDGCGPSNRSPPRSTPAGRRISGARSAA